MTALTLLWRFRLPLLVLAAAAWLWHIHTARSAAEARADAAELRAATAEARAELDRTVSTLEITHAVTVSTLAPLPVVADRLRGLCHQALHPAADKAGLDLPGARGNPGDRPADIDGLAADLQACQVNKASLTRALGLLRLIYQGQGE